MNFVMTNETSLRILKLEMLASRSQKKHRKCEGTKSGPHQRKERKKETVLDKERDHSFKLVESFS